MAKSRVVPTNMRKRLREEVNFGCPVCRSPFLTYHHFDPPWEPLHIHNEKGIIALCSNCHGFAHGGSFTNQQLHHMKVNPPNAPPEGKIPWRFRKALVISGGNYFIANNPNLLIRIAGRKVFALHLNDYLSIDALIADRNGIVIAQIQQNDIIADIDKLSDLKCSVQANEISILSSKDDTKFLLKFSRKNIETVVEKAPNGLREVIREKSLDLLENDLLPTIDVKFNVFGPDFRVESNKKFSVDIKNNGKITFPRMFMGEHHMKFMHNGYEIVHLGSE